MFFQVADQEELETLRELMRIREAKGKGASFMTIAKNPYR